MSYSSKYVPKNLTESDKKKQIKSIKEKTYRPKLESFKSKRSSHVEMFEKKYGTKITNEKFINNTILKKEGQLQILKKGMGAYYSGSRPNQTPQSWAYARLASVIMNGPARKSDMKIWLKYKL